ncbi:hypothetical protein BC2926_38620 [Bacillus cereus]|nr:hypothetical protein BC2926_38620 [Bacillus cereus]
MINVDKICIRNSELVDFECDIDRFHLYILVEKDKFLPFIHTKGKGFERVKKLPEEIRNEIKNFIEEKNKELRLRKLFEDFDYGISGISTYLKRMLTRDKLDHIMFLFERARKNEKMKLFELQEYFDDMYYELDIEFDLMVSRFYEEDLIRLKFSTVKKDGIADFSRAFGSRRETVGEFKLHIDLIGMYEDRGEDTFIVRSIEEAREKKNEKTKKSNKKRPGKRKKVNGSGRIHNNR